MKTLNKFRLRSSFFSLFIATFMLMSAEGLLAGETCQVALKSGEVNKDPENEGTEKAELPVRYHQLLDLHERIKMRNALSSEDLRLLYGIDDNDAEENKSIAMLELISKNADIISKRSISADLNFIGVNLNSEDSSFHSDEALSKKFLFHFGDLIIKETPKEKIHLPSMIGKGLKIEGLKSLQQLQFPIAVGGDVDIRGLKSATEIRLPRLVGGSLIIIDLVSAQGVRFPQIVDGDVILPSLKSARGLQLPRVVNGDVDLSSVESVEGLEMPEIVKGRLILRSLKSAKGLHLPKVVGGDIDLRLLPIEEIKAPASLRGKIRHNKTINEYSASGFRLI